MEGSWSELEGGGQEGSAVVVVVERGLTVLSVTEMIEILNFLVSQYFSPAEDLVFVRCLSRQFLFMFVLMSEYISNK